MNATPEAQLARFVWESRYRDADARPPETSIGDSFKRVARAVAAIEKNPAPWGEQFLAALRDLRLLPGGRILAGAGTEHNVTLSNCFVMGMIEDSLDGIFESLKEGALTIQQGGGVGYDFSALRPRGARAQRTGRIASGPVSFMHIWDAMCATINSTAVRRGAMMATLRCDHPDVEAFIDAKRAADALRHFNLSVLVSEAFMQAVLGDEEWPLVFPDLEGTVQRAWSGGTHEVPCRVYRVVRARELWQRLCDSAYDCAEPGVLFIDQINNANNLAYCEHLSATNPCGEAPLPDYGSCNLASINLTAFVKAPFAANAHFDQDGIAEVAAVAVRFLDDVIEIAKYPLLRQREQAHRSRRIGIGITGLADALAMLGLRYDSEEARSAASHAMRVIRDAAYAASAELARERGAFPAFEVEAYLSRPFIAELPKETRAAIAAHGIRNSHLLAIAPAGSVSVLAHNVSTGIAPMFGIETLHRVASTEGGYRHFQVTDYAYALWRQLRHSPEPKPAFFVDAENIAPRDHLLMQAALARFIDGSIAKTVTLPRSFPRKAVAELFSTAHVLGLKGCTVFRTGARVRPIERGHEDPNAREEAAIEQGCTVGRSSD